MANNGIFPPISPATTSGTQLAAILNSFKDTMVSGLSGTSRPVNLQAWGYWIDTTNAPVYEYKVYDGTSDIIVFSINSTSGTATISNIDSSIEILKQSNDAVGPKLKLLKERISGGGQTLINDAIGEIEFKGTRDDSIDTIQARIKATSQDNVTATNQGSTITFELTEDNAASMVEVMRLMNSKVGIGTDEPENTLHVKGTGIQNEKESDDAIGSEIISQKKRASGLGQVQSGDVISTHRYKSVDDAGSEIEVAKDVVSAVETHTTSAKGTKKEIYITKAGQSSQTKQVEIADEITFYSKVNATDLEVTNLTATNTTLGNVTEIEDAQIEVNKGGTNANANSFKAGIRVDIIDGTDAVIGYDSTKNSKFVVGLAGSEKEILTADGTQTVTGKTIDFDLNTASNIDNADIKAGAGIDATKIADGSVDNTEFQRLNGITGNIQTLLDAKTDESGGSLTDGSIITPTRLDMKKDTYANLVTYAVGATNGEKCWATDIKKEYTTRDGVLVETGSGSGVGGINFIENGRAETDTSGWATFKDPAASTPDNGTGGTATNISWTRITTNQLEGDGSFLFSKGAANAQGEGVSYDLTFDRARYGANQYITFSYEIASGTYTDGHLGVFFYDITNSKLVRLSDEVVKNSGIVERHVCNFQPDITCLTGRLIFMVTNSEAVNTWTMRIDEVTLGPLQKQETAIITDPVDFTPVLYNTTGLTVTTVRAKKSFFGKFLFLDVVLSFTGTGTSGSVLQMELPDGLVWEGDTGTTADGFCNGTFFDSSDAISQYALSLMAGGTGAIGRRIVFLTPSKTGPALLGNEIAAGDRISFQVMLPIQGKSSTQVVVDEYSNRDVFSKIITSTTSILTSQTKITFNSTDTDTVNGFSSSTYTCKSPGRHRFGYKLFLNNTSASTTGCLITVRKNGASSPLYAGSYVDFDTSAGASNDEKTIHFSDYITLNEGDTLELYGLATGAAISLSSMSGSVYDSNCFWVEKVTPPTTKLMSEGYFLDAYNNSGQNILNNTTTTITGWTKTNDSGGNFNATTGVWTAPQNGYITLMSKIVLDTVTGWELGETVQYWFRNITTSTTLALDFYRYPTSDASAATTQRLLTICRTNIPVIAGNTYDFQIIHENDAAVSLETGSGSPNYNFITIRYV